jgi:hypothetical protein
VGSDVAEAQIDDLSDAEIDVLLEIYEVLRLTPDNGRCHAEEEPHGRF